MIFAGDIAVQKVGRRRENKDDRRDEVVVRDHRQEEKSHKDGDHGDPQYRQLIGQVHILSPYKS